MRQKVLAAIIDYFNGSASCFWIDSPTNQLEHRIDGWFPLEDLADAVVKALANEEITTECTK